ncbi:MAG: ABC transporter permease [Tissierellia bacterium]|jgi:D-methionine transport system permease protein|nr:methionine ABC transporter permease [Bacillota bacterium]NLK58766.1 ABC transporter permease [Tissierellia bacterium]
MNLMLTALLQTVYMVLASTLIAVVLGFPLAVILLFTRPGGLRPNEAVYTIVNTLVNVFRSFPFIILMIVLIPLGQALIGKSTGTTATIIPLSIAAAPFVARIIEQSLLEADPGLVEAARSMGANPMQILFQVLLPETTPSLILGITTSVINIIGYSAMAGAIGGGGLGDVAIRFGLYRRSQPEMLWGSVLLILLFVQLVQWMGNFLSRKLNHA